MGDSLFQSYIRNIILPLYLIISNECVIKDSKVMKRPMIFKNDSGPRRSKEDLDHVHFLEEMNNIGLKIIFSVSNTTSVHTELHLFVGHFKGSCRSRTLDRFSEKLDDKNSLESLL